MSGGDRNQGQDLYDGKPGHMTMLADFYNGESSWDDYVSHFETVCEINDWSLRERGRMLAASLRGLARTCLSELREDRTDYYRLTRILAERFGHTERPELYVAEFKNRVRKEGENLRDLGRGLRRLATLAYPEMAEVYRDQLAKDQFIDAIEDAEMRIRIFRARPRTLEEAVTTATEVETFRRVEAQRSGSSRPVRGYARQIEATERSFVRTPRLVDESPDLLHRLEKLEEWAESLFERQGNGNRSELRGWSRPQ